MPTSFAAPQGGARPPGGGPATGAMPVLSPDPAGYAGQLATKVARYKADFAPFDLPEPAVFESPRLRYRLRAEFRLWHTRDAQGRNVLHLGGSQGGEDLRIRPPCQHQAPQISFGEGGT